MGNNQKKPFQHVDVFIQVPKNIYQSGQTIEGSIHLNIGDQKLPYEKLMLGFYCRETQLLKASKQKEGSYQTQEKFTYTIEKQIHDFTVSTIQKGQYSFPFEIKLPQNLPSSFCLSKQDKRSQHDPHGIQIRYAIKAMLSSVTTPQQKYGDLTKIHYLNIIKPIIAQRINPISCKKNEFSKSCLCFGLSTFVLSIYLNKSSVYSGEKIQINGEANNTYGTKLLEGLSCQLFERNIVTNEKKKYFIDKERGVLHIVKALKVKKGDVENFSFSYKIPDYLQHSHSVGNYSGLIYFLKFQYIFKGGCDPIKCTQIPIEIQTKTPKLQVNIDQIPSSYEWNPIVKEKIILDTIAQYNFDQGFPLQSYRQQLQKNKVEAPSFNYFNQMNAGYLTKNPQNSNKPLNYNCQTQQQHQLNPYAASQDGISNTGEGQPQKTLENKQNKNSAQNSSQFKRKKKIFSGKK